jgi:O-antigen/teichoic acid export membrane protein
MTEGKDWSPGTRIGLFASVAATIVARSFQDFYGLRLILQQDHGAFMRPQVLAGVVRMLALATARATGALTAIVASMLSSLLAIIPAAQYRRRTGRMPARGERAFQRQIISYALPLSPMLLNGALQGQIAIFVASTFASTRVLAEVGALSRIGQLYAVVGIINGLVVAPKIARAPREELRGIVVMTMSGATAFVALLALFAFAVPGVLVALLGSEYVSLRAEVGAYVVGTGLTFLMVVVFTINNSRGYVYWWLTALEVLGVLAVQAVAVIILDLSTVSNIVWFLILSGACQLLVGVAGLWYGLRRGPRATSALGSPLLSADGNR